MKNRLNFAWLLASSWFFLTGCAGNAPKPAENRDAPSATVHTFEAGEGAIFVNAYLVETNDHVVVIDTTLLNSSAQLLRAELLKLNKPLHSILLTHGHPDHYNGAAIVRGSTGVEIISTAGTQAVIRKSDAAKAKQWASVFGKEWPAPRAFPNRILGNRGSFEVDGVRFEVRDLGPGESDRDSYWLVTAGGKKMAFIGDAVLNGVHAYLTDGHSSQWLNNLARLKKDLAGVEVLYPGHGTSGGVELLDWQRGYLEFYRETVKSLAKGQPTLNVEQKKTLTERMNQFLGNRKLEFLIALGADPVAKELSQAKHR